LGGIVSFWTTEEDRKLLKSVCKARGENLSSFIRRSIRKELASLSFYSKDTKKALGVKIEKERKIKDVFWRTDQKVDDLRRKI